MSDPSSSVPKAQALDSSWAEDPLNYLIKAFVAFLQTVFEKAPVGYFHWSPEAEETEIFITEETPIALDTVGQRPSISVVLGAVRWNASSLDEMLGMNPVTGLQRHTDLLPGTMSLNCCSRVASEARFLAWQCARHIWILRRIFMQERFIHEVGRNITVGPVSPAGAIVQGDTEGEWLAAAVSCPFFLQWYERVTPETDWNGSRLQQLREIGITYHTRMNPAQQSLTSDQNAGTRPWGDLASRQPRPPSIRGRVLPTAPLTVKTKVS